MLKTTRVDDFVRISSFSTPNGCDEFYISIRTPEGVTFPKALGMLSEQYRSTLDRFGLADDTVAFSRLFLSDIANQKTLLMQSAFCGTLARGALSIIEQKPLDGGPVSLLSYHIKGNRSKINKQITPLLANGWSNSVRITGDHYSLLLTANYISGQPESPYVQTKRIFDHLTSDLKNGDLSISGNLIRTWVFLRDIDCHYSDMVRARREFFETHGLTAQRRFPASTGIQGKSCDPHELIAVDALSMSGLQEEQVVKIEAPTHLSSAFSYGVTFERGLEVRFGDRSHLYISGTASINNKGEVIHIGDVEGQTRRTLENIRALLATRNAGIGDLACIIAYARNYHDRAVAAAVLERELGDSVPFIFAEGPVCRPSWLIELEGVAVIPGASDFPPFL